MFQKSYYHFKIQNGYKRLTFIFLIESKRKKEATRPKVNSRPDLVKLSEHVCLIDAEAVNKELTIATSIQKRGNYSLNISSHIKAEVGKYALYYST